MLRNFLAHGTEQNLSRLSLLPIVAILLTFEFKLLYGILVPFYGRGKPDELNMDIDSLATIKVVIPFQIHISKLIAIQGMMQCILMIFASVKLSNANSTNAKPHLPFTA